MYFFILQHSSCQYETPQIPISHNVRHSLNLENLTLQEKLEDDSTNMASISECQDIYSRSPFPSEPHFEERFETSYEKPYNEPAILSNQSCRTREDENNKPPICSPAPQDKTAVKTTNPPFPHGQNTYNSTDSSGYNSSSTLDHNSSNTHLNLPRSANGTRTSCCKPNMSCDNTAEHMKSVMPSFSTSPLPHPCFARVSDSADLVLGPARQRSPIIPSPNSLDIPPIPAPRSGYPLSSPLSNESVFKDTSNPWQKPLPQSNASFASKEITERITEVHISNTEVCCNTTTHDCIATENIEGCYKNNTGGSSSPILVTCNSPSLSIKSDKEFKLKSILKKSQSFHNRSALRMGSNDRLNITHRGENFSIHAHGMIFFILTGVMI